MSWKMGFQWRRNAKGPLPPSLPLSLPSPFLPTALSALFIYPSRRRCYSSGSNRSDSGGGSGGGSGGNSLSPARGGEGRPTNRLTIVTAIAAGSETEFGHISNLIRALRRPRERQRERPRESLPRQQLYTSFDFYLGSEPAAAGRPLVRWHFELGRSQSVRVATFPRE